MNPISKHLLLKFSLISFATLTGAIEPIQLDLQDDFHVGDRFQIRLIVPKKTNGILVLRDPEGSLIPIVPNQIDTFFPCKKGKHLIPAPLKAYEIILTHPGQYRAFTISSNYPLDGTKLSSIKEVDESLVTLIAEINRVLITNQPPDLSLKYSNVVFDVAPTPRPPTQLLPLENAKIDTPNNPRFSPNDTDLLNASEYRKLWNWARLIRSPAHRHQSFIIECHSYSKRTQIENLLFSEARAEYIVNYLINQCGIMKERLTPSAKGDFEPLPGRGKYAPENERVTLVVDDTAGRRILR